MRFSLILVFALCIVAALVGHGEAKWRGWKKIEKVGKKAFEEAEKALPVVQAYAGPIGVVGAVVGKK
ncbi:hypothetical protein FQR65_LT04813 [Abscondita terminalis]|nr:hypothetical protein FQR65_LT04813 [Abscondita terminalis]